jgi:hypothetical protein
MFDHSSAVAGLKRQFNLIISEPQRMFLAVFSVLMLLGPVVVSVFVHPVPADKWISYGASFSGVAALCAGWVAVHRYAPWISWFGAYGLIFQAAIAVLVLLTPIGQALGFLKPPDPTWLSGPEMKLAMGWAAIALACAWGMFRNRWWGYLGEVLVLLSIVAAAYLAPIQDSHARTRPELFSGENWLSAIASWGMFAMLIRSLAKRGFERLRIQRAAIDPA